MVILCLSCGILKASVKMADCGSTATGFICRHCAASVDLETANQHECFIGRLIFSQDNILFAEGVEKDSEAVYTCSECLQTLESLQEVFGHHCFNGSLDIKIDENRVAHSVPYTNEETTQKADWTKNKTLALIALYEANLHLIDNPKRKNKIWKTIAEGLRDMNISMSTSQVSWKMQSLLGKYKDCLDNNRLSGRAHKTFEYFERLDEFLGQDRIASADYTMSSKVPSRGGAPKFKESSKKHDNSAPSTSSSTQNESQNDKSPPNGSGEGSSGGEGASIPDRKSRGKHGSGSKLARGKLELQNQWSQYLEDKQAKDAEKEKKREEYQKIQEEKIEMKRKIAEEKLNDKRKRHEDHVNIETAKLKLLAEFIGTKDK